MDQEKNVIVLFHLTTIVGIYDSDENAYHGARKYAQKFNIESSNLRMYEFVLNRSYYLPYAKEVHPETDSDTDSDSDSD